MPENDCPINGVNCVSIARVEALERALEAQKQHSSLAREKIYDRLGELERGMATVTTQYGNIIDRLSSMSADLNALKEKPSKRWETVVAAIITGAIGYLLASIGSGSGDFAHWTVRRTSWENRIRQTNKPSPRSVSGGLLCY